MGSLAMDGVSMNHYEKQLYTVFKTFDVDNEEALNKSAVLELCDALQLEDRGAALVDTLFERRADRVTFSQFRNGLLTVLGGGDPAPAPPKDSVAVPISSTFTPPSTAPAAPSAPTFSQSDDDSSGREVAPKFVFGSKKYGRRSRPQRSSAAPDDPPSPRAASVPRLDTDDKRARSSQRMKYRRSTSAMDSRDRRSADEGDLTTQGFDHDRRIDYEQALALCRDLRMDRIDRALVERIFEESPTDDTTVGEFFDRLNASLTSSLETTQGGEAVIPGDTDDGVDDESGTGLSTALVVNAWENAGIPHPGRLLMELGFATAVLRPLDLERALEDELRAYSEPLDDQRDARVLFSIAALELNRFRLKRARKRAEVAVAERDKLRADVAEANRRARLLAQDNDESHARMEAELAASVRRAEARHGEALRLAAADAAAERDRATAVRSRLESELALRTESEVRLREEIEVQNSRFKEMEIRTGAAEARAAAAERSAAQSAAELREARAGGGAAPDAGAGAAARELAAQLAELRRDNERLRDRNDELCCALEARARRADAAAAGGDHLSAELGELLSPRQPEECDSSPASIDQKLVSSAEAARRLRAIFDDALAAAPAAPAAPAAAGGCPRCRSLDDVLASVHARVRELSDSVILLPAGLDDSGAGAEAGVQTDADAGPPSGLLAEVEALRRELVDAGRRHDDEKQKLSDLVKDLEVSLEQLKNEYDKCEDYWSRKLDEERDAFNEEQRLGDERLAELVAKIGEYERQFAPAAALPTIDERDALEAQVNDLEDEFAAYRRTKDGEVRARDERIARLADQVAALTERLEAAARGAGAGARAAEREAGCACAALAERCARLAAARGAGAREAAALRGRAARAEAAVRRLHARLAAADLLVKDLYVENCHLAHRRAL